MKNFLCVFHSQSFTLDSFPFLCRVELIISSCELLWLTPCRSLFFAMHFFLLREASFLFMVWGPFNFFGSLCIGLQMHWLWLIPLYNVWYFSFLRICLLLIKRELFSVLLMPTFPTIKSLAPIKTLTTLVFGNCGYLFAWCLHGLSLCVGYLVLILLLYLHCVLNAWKLLYITWELLWPVWSLFFLCGIVMTCGLCLSFHCIHLTPPLLCSRGLVRGLLNWLGNFSDPCVAWGMLFFIADCLVTACNIMLILVTSLFIHANSFKFLRVPFIWHRLSAFGRFLCWQHMLTIWNIASSTLL